MDIIITSAIKQSCLTHSLKGSDYVIRDAEFVKFRKDARSSCLVQSSSTRRLIPLALNHLGLRGCHFHAMMKEFATHDPGHQVRRMLPPPRPLRPLY
jgi:hypothetical protein